MRRLSEEEKEKLRQKIDRDSLSIVKQGIANRKSARRTLLAVFAIYPGVVFYILYIVLIVLAFVEGLILVGVIMLFTPIILVVLYVLYREGTRHGSELW